MINLLTIKKNVTNELIINKSKFIAFIIKITNENEVNISLNKIKKNYPGATHYCYAYIINNIKRFNDDGEPGGTAGMPILNVLENNNLTNILCVIVRYFGGIKLGAGGLVRAYSNATSQAIGKTQIVKLVPGKEIEINFSYNNIKNVEYLLKDNKIIDKQFNETINFIFLISCDNYQEIEKKLKLLTNYINIKTNILIEK